MPTIQVRDIPEDAYARIRARAREEGLSLQAYMRREVIGLAQYPSKREAVARIERSLREHPGAGPTVDAILEDVRADRR